MSRHAPQSTRDADTGFEALRQSPAFQGAVEPLEEHEHSNDHFALIYEDPAELMEAAVLFVRQGLERGEQCLYVIDRRTEDEASVAAALSAGGIDVESARSSGALTFTTVADTYLRQKPFQPDEMISFYRDTVEAALEEYAGLRVIAGTSWIDDIDFEAFLEYEGRVNALFETTDSMALCHYRRDQHDPSVIRDIIRTHPHLISDGAVCHNFYYTPPDQLFDEENASAEVDRMLGTLEDRVRAKTEVTEHKRFLQELNEITSDPDRSFEEKLESLFEFGCEWFDLDLGALNRVDPEADLLEVDYISGDHEYYKPGETFPLSQTYCAVAADSKAAASVSDPPADGYDDLAAYEEFGVESYLGTYIPIENDVNRTFAFIADGTRPGSFSKQDRTCLELMAQWVKYELEHREREAELQQSKNHFERIFENSQDAIFIIDPDRDELIDANPAASEMIGCPRSELLTCGPSDLHPDEMDQFREFISEVQETGTGWTDELTCKTVDRGKIPAEISASRMTHDGRPVVLAAVRDVSERRKHERAQRRLYEIAADPDRTFDEKLQAVLELGCDRFDIAFGGLARVDADDDLFQVEVMREEHDHLVEGERYPLSETYCEEAVVDDREITAIAGSACGEYEGKLCYDRFGVRTYLGTYLELEGTHNRTFFFLSNEQREEPFTDTEQTFHHLMGQWVKYELERQQYERELEDTVDRLQQSNDRLKQFAYAASHDLQEPLRMVSSYLQLLERNYHDDLDEDAQEYIDFAVDGAHRMREMVDDLLAYSRVEQSDGEFEPVDFRAVVDRVTQDLKARIDETDAEISTGSLPTIAADADQVEQLFRNLLSNAIKYNEGTPRVDITATERADHWEFAVSDDGIGIDPDRTDRIFEVFKRLHHDDEYSGTGIGLALCQEIVENHGGDIWVDSESGAGSTFYFTLPAVAAE